MGRIAALRPGASERAEIKRHRSGGVGRIRFWARINAACHDALWNRRYPPASGRRFAVSQPVLKVAAYLRARFRMMTEPRPGVQGAPALAREGAAESKD